MSDNVLDVLLNRRSVRAFEDRTIEPEVRQAILHATLRAPTAGNMMLYSIIEVTDQEIKDQLAESCDHQPFIAKAPMVWIFLADYQRWYDEFMLNGAEKYAAVHGKELRTPQEGDMLLACTDAIIAAHQSVIAAESFGLGSCYIGDIIENYEFHEDLLELPPYVVPIAMLVYGYPTEQQKNRTLTTRFNEKFILHTNKYTRSSPEVLKEMLAELDTKINDIQRAKGLDSYALMMYWKKFDSDFSKEMTRSAKKIIQNWR